MSPVPANDETAAKTLVLASGSPRRRELLAQMGVEPVVRPVDVDETPRPEEEASTYVLRLASEKARAEACPGELVLAADTVVALAKEDGGDLLGNLLGKPRDEDDARAMLRRLRDRSHQVLTGVALWDPAAESEELSVVVTEVVFGPMSDEEIDAYVRSGEPMDKAGAYAIQGLGGLFVERIEGNYSNVVGLPLPLVYRWLRDAGLEVLAQ